MPDHRPTLSTESHNTTSIWGGILCLLLLLWCFAASAKAENPIAKAQIFYATDTESLTRTRATNPKVIQLIVDKITIAATGKADRASAWRSLVKPTDRVGIKVSAAGGSVSGTHPDVVNAIASGLIDAGVPAANIIIWDRKLEDLLAAGFRRESRLYQLRWVDPANGYDRKSQLTAPVLGRLIWGDSGFGNRTGSRMEDRLSSGEQLSSNSYFSKVLSKNVTKVINVPSLTDSFLTGVNGALANMTLPNLDNWRRFTRDPAFGDPYLAEIYADEMIRGKVVLTILDGLILQYAGGPVPNPGFSIANHTLYASKDPVAIDATAARLLNENRSPAKLPTLDEMTHWIESASVIGLGKYKESDIELVPVATRPPPTLKPSATP